MNEHAPAISSDHLHDQVAQYTHIQACYQTFATALKRVLEQACKDALPDAFVQARSKSLTSFAEKAIRKFTKYKDPVNQLSDLCGARVIVQTLEQVRAVRRFIESNFTILEADEKALSLGDDKFGYRDMHYIVRVLHEKAGPLGFTPDELAAIGNKRAEIQVRTWVQHAWADTLHDRMYKTKLKFPAEFKRTGALLAAIMEDGDRAFNRLAGDIDGMLANFTAYADEDAVCRELNVQELILAGAEPAKKPEIALRIARLAAPRGDYARVVAALSAYAATPAPLGCTIRTELGYAMCRMHRAAPRAAPYTQGQAYLRHVVEQCRTPSLQTVPDLRWRVSTLARAQARLAWSYGALDETASLARTSYREALELEPDNPYFLADVVGHEINYQRRKDFIGAMAAAVRRAIDTCHEHVRNGTEMPYAAFTAGRLLLLLNETNQALGAYARGLTHVLAGVACVPPDVLEAEEKWLHLVTQPDPLTEGFCWAMDLLRMAGRIQSGTPSPHKGAVPISSPVFIIAGGAASLTASQADQLRPMLKQAFSGFSGTLISGGTRIGVPGCVGDAAAYAGPPGKRPFTLIGYIPRIRPGDAPRDDRYDRCVECGEHSFTPEQLLRNWADILAAGIRPDAVRLLGFGGGPLSAVEYRLALGLGASVGLISGSGGAADDLLKDSLWAGSPHLLPLPCDSASVRALTHPAHARFAPDDEKNAGLIETMAIAFHKEYVRNSVDRLPDNLKPWGNQLKNTFKSASREQAKYTVHILEASGFEVRPATPPGKPVIFQSFTDAEVEHMAELEHGRWNIERLRNGWRPGRPRDDARKIHDCLVSWADLPDPIRHYDRDAVRKFPDFLAKAGLEVVRKKEPPPHHARKK